MLRSLRSLAVVAVMKKTNDHAEPTKVERLKILRLVLDSKSTIHLKITHV